MEDFYKNKPELVEEDDYTFVESCDCQGMCTCEDLDLGDEEETCCNCDCQDDEDIENS
jgi:hypothetical protein